ncbi:MAG: hypothetical protein M1817_006730 [Caeruleum heppii]|nr:MAG: hypothetical protein M1817_006730 [Caeruleum heppii]
MTRPAAASEELPPDSAIRDALRNTVDAIFASGDLDQLTVKRVRAAAENELGLSDGYLKDDSQWKLKSKTIIEEHSDKLFAAKGTSNSNNEAGEDAATSTKSSDATSSASIDVPHGRKRKRGVATNQIKPETGPRPDSDGRDQASDAASAGSHAEETKSIAILIKSKASKQPASDDDVSETPAGPSKLKHRPGVQKRRPQRQSEGDTDDDDSDGQAQISSSRSKPKIMQETTGSAESESDMSVVLDEEPSRPKVKRSETKSSRPSKSSKREKGVKAKDPSDLDPQEAEIKRLQSWLLKCGVRKLWHRELAGCSTSKQKINHLKGMLRDVGMEGRFSVDKAKQIKEERELRADVEAVQESAKRWGDFNEGSGTGSKRRLVKGSKALDFLGEDEGEETD